ncbi:MAG: AcrB/AcrD/AcrF family protein [Nitrospiraceae bacterium]|nr:AcrB/AcrD/AcrF family protein [Nitrospiraceae bacterium]
MTDKNNMLTNDIEAKSWIDKIILFSLQNKLVVALLVLFFVAWGIMVAPFDWDTGWLPRNPVAVDAIPDIGENQQIVFTEWMGRSPQDVEDQITYPMTVSLLGIPGVKTIRSFSFFGFSSVYVIFKENVDFYWSRSRVLEKLNSLPADTLPDGVQPALGPDATALGQVFWYTLEGQDPDGNPAGGWDLHELRTIQDWYVRYGLLSAEGVSEAASIGGFVQEYQIDVDPDAMRANNVTLDEVFMSIRRSNVDVGARTIEVNKVEYVIRGLGFIESIEDIEDSVIKVNENVPISIRDVANVTLGPALRRGALDKEGAEAVGGVVVVRYGANPLAVIKNVKAKIAEIAPGLPTKAIIDHAQVSREEVETFAGEHGFEAYDGALLNQDTWLDWLRTTERVQWPSWVTTSQVAVVPFYDRSGLIYETLGTLNSALTEEILVTIIVVLVMLLHLRSSIIVSGLLPLAVLMCFIAMKLFGVDANIVALSGIAIAIGTMVDMGVIICENILKKLDEAGPDEDKLHVVFKAASEVGGAVITAVSTTVVSFLPVFTMTAAEGKLFKPLAFTKTFALVASVIVAIVIIPPLAHTVLGHAKKGRTSKKLLFIILGLAGIAILFLAPWYVGTLVIVVCAYNVFAENLPKRIKVLGPWVSTAVAVLFVGILLADHWMPLGPEKGVLRNFIFVAAIIGSILGFFLVFQRVFASILQWCLAHKGTYLLTTLAIVLAGGAAWMGFGTIFGFVPALARRAGIAPERVTQSSAWTAMSEKLPGLGKEFMPPLDEGSYLYMPTTMPHASIGEALDVLQYQDQAFSSIPEIDSVVGKVGRVESPLDPAPISMIETVINYKPEYITDQDGRRINFRHDHEKDEFIRDEQGELIPDANGQPFRQWRDHIRTPNDIWDEIVAAGKIPGSTSAPRLQPIAARIVMLQSGMRAPMGVKVKGPDLATIEQVGLEIERFLKEVPSVEPAAVFADRIVGKPYLEIDIDRKAIARYGIDVRRVQDVIEVAIGGRRITTTVEGRERFPVRVRYMRELRDRIDTLEEILVAGAGGVQIPIAQLANINYIRGPQAIKSEDTFLVGYVLFDMKPGYAEVDVVEECQRYLAEKRASGEFVMPSGVSYTFAGNYENQIRSQKTLSVVLPLALFVIFMILYFQFRSVATTSLVFSGIIVAWAGGFILIWLYAQPWFLDFSVFEVNMRDLFQVHPINLSVAIWVGFLALFGIASDNGVVIATFLDQSFTERRPKTVQEIREATVAGANRRIRPCLMTTGTTILALIPVLTSTGRGADIMVPMAIPSFGGMLVVLITVFLVPVLYCWIKELQLRFSREEESVEHL